LYTSAQQRLHKLGVTHIHDGDFDMFADARGCAASGRMPSVIWILGSGERV
jgi:hypothetical protein